MTEKKEKLKVTIVSKCKNSLLSCAKMDFEKIYGLEESRLKNKTIKFASDDQIPIL